MGVKGMGQISARNHGFGQFQGEQGQRPEAVSLAGSDCPR